MANIVEQSNGVKKITIDTPYEALTNSVASLTTTVAGKANQSALDTTNGNVSANAAQLADITLLVKSSGGDDTTNINTAINAVSQKGGGKVLLPDPSYLALGIQMQSNVTLEGYNTTINKNGGSGTTHIVESKGSATGTPISLSANASVGNTSVTVASTKGISVGNYVLVYDNNYVSNPLGRNQELCRVTGVTSTSVTFASPLIGSYSTTSSASIVVISPVSNAKVKGLILNIPSGTSGGGFYGFLNVGTLVEKCESWRPKETSAFGFEQSALCRFNQCKAFDGQTNSIAGTSYGFYIGDSSHYCSVERCYSENVRENPISYNVRRSGFYNCQAKGNYDDGFNTHGTGNDHIYILNNMVEGSIGQGVGVGTSTHPSGDTNIFIEGNIIMNSGSNPIYVAAPSSGSLPNKNIYIRNNKIGNYGVVTPNSNGISVAYSSGVFIDDNIVDGANNSNAGYGILANAITNARIRKNDVYNISNGYGIMYEINCSDVLIEKNTIYNVSSYNIRSSGTNTNVVVRQNKADDTLSSFTCDVREANIWGTKRDRDKGATSVADGGTIPHNCVAAPTSIRVAGSVAGQIVTVTSITASNFTVAVKNNDGTVGTTQTVYWEAEV